eukprot:1180871-Prorocentrum_minimum.AAC.2
MPLSTRGVGMCMLHHRWGCGIQNSAARGGVWGRLLLLRPGLRLGGRGVLTGGGGVAAHHSGGGASGPTGAPQHRHVTARDVRAAPLPAGVCARVPGQRAGSAPGARPPVYGQPPRAIPPVLLQSGQDLRRPARPGAQARLGAARSASGE